MTGVYWHLGRDGVMYLVDIVTGQIHNRRGKPIGKPCADGYVRIAGHYAHRAIWEAVFGPIPAGMEINHINGNRADNRLHNLEVVTRRENISHAIRLGRIKCGEDAPNAKLSADRVREARKRVAAGEPKRRVATEFGVDPKTLRDAIARVTWRHVEDTTP